MNLKAYTLVRKEWIEDIQSQAYIYKHNKSGARVVVISNDDDNKVFYIGFRTPPKDDTGVPHIIEHSTLCGSAKFSVKDPFVELCKGSLNTYLNAMTYPDKTVYPIASYNEKDFKNLMDIYLDAVFHPNILRIKEIFMQEGWHYELDPETGDLTINGVVYNEMKGYYSSADELHARAVSKSLFPNNAYCRDYGGDPAEIPSLTYEAFLEFYKEFYHPSNSYIYLYGDMDVEERLTFLDEQYLSEFDVREVDTEVTEHEPFTTMQESRIEYSITEEEPLVDNSYLSYNKVIDNALNQELVQAFDVLDYALVSAPGAPVRQALLDAGIGKDVYGSYDSGTLQPIFSVVSKQANEEQKEQFVSIIESTLRDLVKNGIDRKSLLAAINSSEFHFREADYGNSPKGLMYGLLCLDSWLYDEERPFLNIQILFIFEWLKTQIDTGYFENLVQKYLLDNQYGTIVTVVPVKGLGEKQEEEWHNRLQEKKAAMSEDELAKLQEEMDAFEAYQQMESSEEALKSIPTLTRDDIMKAALPFSNVEKKVGEIPMVFHDYPANGIDYVTFIFGANQIPRERVAYLALMRSVIGYVNTESYQFAELRNEINIHTGGIRCGVSFYPNLKAVDDMKVTFEIRLRTLGSNLEEAMRLFKEIVMTSDFSDVKRLRQIVAQVKSRIQEGLSSSGHVVAAMRAGAYASRYNDYVDMISGIEYYRSLCEIDHLMETNPQQVVDTIKEMCEQLFAKENLMISFTSDEKNCEEAMPIFEKYLEFLPKTAKESVCEDWTVEKKTEGFYDSSTVQYVARGGNFVKKGFEYSGTLRILRMILSYDYLWKHIREQGGAYGCMCSFLRTGESYFVSYRDPKLAETNEAYDKVAEYIRNFEATEDEMTKYIIGTFGGMDTPMNPEAKGNRSMSAYLENISYEEIQQERDEIKGATAEDIRALADLVQAVLDEKQICVIGNEKTIRQHGDMFDSVCGLLEEK